VPPAPAPAASETAEACGGGACRGGGGGDVVVERGYHRGFGGSGKEQAGVLRRGDIQFRFGGFVEGFGGGVGEGQRGDFVQGGAGGRYDGGGKEAEGCCGDEERVRVANGGSGED